MGESLFINPIKPIGSIGSMEENIQSQKKTEPRESMFADIFRNVWDNVAETKDEHSKQEYLLATGQIDDPQDVVIAGVKAEMAVELLAQLRNKALESYEQIMRTSL